MNEWLRLPKDQEKCPVSGLSRSSLNEILNETDPVTGEKLVESLVKVKEGAKRGIKLINRRSLLEYLAREAEAQNGLRFADHIRNPDRLSINQVLEDLETFNNFLGPDQIITMDDWHHGNLSTRRSRLVALIDMGVVAQDRVPPPGEDAD
jgi:hypothetical protein